MAYNPRQELYLEISMNLTDGELTDLRTYVSGIHILSPGFVQKANAHQICNQLEKEQKLKPGDLSLLANLLRKISRHDYAEMAEKIAENERKELREPQPSTSKRNRSDKRPEKSTVESSKKQTRTKSDSEEGESHVEELREPQPSTSKRKRRGKHLEASSLEKSTKQARTGADSEALESHVKAKMLKEPVRYFSGMTDNARQELYLEISRNITDGELTDLRNYVSGAMVLPAGFVQHANAHQICNQMEKEQKLKPGDLTLLAELMRKIGRHDYSEQAEKIAEYERKELRDSQPSTSKRKRRGKHLEESSLETSTKQPRTESDSEDGESHVEVAPVEVEECFDKVIAKISHKWDDLARELGFNRGQIKGIETMELDQDRRCREMLHRWRNRDGRGATLQVLKQALIRIDERLTAESLEDDSNVPIEIYLRGPKAAKAYKDACQQGTVRVYSTRVPVVGQYRAGKTCLVNRLMGEPVRLDEPITDGIQITSDVQTKTWKKSKEELDEFGATMAELLMQTQSAEEKGKESSSPTGDVVEPVQLDHTILQAIHHHHLSTPGEDGVSPCTTAAHDSRSAMTAPSASPVSPERTFGFRKGRSTISPAITGEVSTEEPQTPSAVIPDSVAERIRKAGITEDELGTADYPRLSFWDFGGQATYYGTHQCFITYRAIYILVMSLLQELSDPVPDLDYKASVNNLRTGEAFEDFYSLIIPLVDYLDHWLNTIRSHTLPRQLTEIGQPSGTEQPPLTEQLQNKGQPSDTGQVADTGPSPNREQSSVTKQPSGTGQPPVTEQPPVTGQPPDTEQPTGKGPAPDTGPVPGRGQPPNTGPALGRGQPPKTGQPPDRRPAPDTGPDTDTEQPLDRGQPPDTGPAPDTGQPPAIIVLTRKDKVTKEAVEMYKKKIFNHISGKAAGNLVMPEIFTIDNTANDNTADELRNYLRQVANSLPYMGEEIPISWLHLKSKLREKRKEGDPFCKLEEIVELARDPDINITDNNDLAIVLNFLHDRGDIIFFDEPSLRDDVTLQPQVMIDAFKTIITVPEYQQDRKNAKDQEIEKMWERLEEEGVLSDKLLTEIWERKDRQLEKPFLLKHKTFLKALMEKYYLICNATHAGDTSDESQQEENYFVPALLKCERENSELYPSNMHLCKQALYIEFSEKFLPSGMFNRLQALCVRRFGLESSRVYADCARFPTDDEGQAFVITKVNHFLKIELLSSCNVFTEGMRVRKFLSSALFEIKEKWIPCIQYKLCFSKKEERRDDPVLQALPLEVGSLRQFWG
uniref:Death domain-containing protein n=1 Tax=Branchiostoma floridae TaxID=7739 RepID=C3ZC34_BRAFL|eukprot:XP_002593795.1 hypothetical protein BRAFLDRAFT_75746 [Branchiostoma floridae]